MKFAGMDLSVQVPKYDAYLGVLRLKQKLDGDGLDSLSKRAVLIAG